ncbi:hypothetical protein NUM3379_43680 [Kineococcus sp. NUM-3379]
MRLERYRRSSGPPRFFPAGREPSSRGLRDLFGERVRGFGERRFRDRGLRRLRASADAIRLQAPEIVPVV